MRSVDMSRPEAETVRDIGRELVHDGDVRGYTLQRLWEEWEQAPPENETHSVRVDLIKSYSMYCDRPFGGAGLEYEEHRERVLSIPDGPNYWDMSDAELKREHLAVVTDFNANPQADYGERFSMIEDAILQRIGAPDTADPDTPEWQAVICQWSGA